MRDFSILEVSKPSLYRRYVNFQQYGEIPALTRKNNRKSYSKKWKDEEIRHLLRIINKYPQLYLDEISDHYLARFPEAEESKSDNDIWRCLRNKCGYKLKVYTEIALQRSKLERAHYMHALNLMVSNPDQVVLVDESSKDKNAARRRRIWALQEKRQNFDKRPSDLLFQYIYSFWDNIIN